jgi:hypothetical protein
MHCTNGGQNQERIKEEAMPRNRARCPFIVWSALLLSLALVPPVLAQESAADTRARETEQQMTDDERFDMIYSLMRVVFTTGQREPRVPADVPQLAGWSKGVKRLGVPDLLQTDASLGIANPGGGQAIAEVLTGRVNPSGRLPITFPASIEQTPHPQLAGFGTPPNTPPTIRYHEGAEVGYRWLAKTGAKPLYAFGHGLSYTSFSYRDFTLSGGETVTATFTVTNIGQREGADVPQVYLTEAAGDKRMRLLGFERANLRPGESRQVTMTADPRLLAQFDGLKQQWHIDAGAYVVTLSRSAEAPVERAEVRLKDSLFGR